MAAPTIENVYPSDGATGIPIGATIWAIFDQEIDAEAVEGSFLVVGPDNDLWTGPDFSIWNRLLTTQPSSMLRSPGYDGIVAGTFTVTKIDDNGNAVSSPSYSGAAGYKSKVVFTPTDVLATLTDFRALIAGRESTSTFIKGVRSRTVWDTHLGSNYGDGNITTYGSYTGSVVDVFYIRCTQSGGQGSARFEWYRSTVPSVKHAGVISQQRRLLADGLSIGFSGTSFEAGDTFSIGVSPAVYMDGVETWTFTSGSGSISTVPSTTSTSPIGTPVPPIPSLTSTVFAVDSSTPEHRASGISLNNRTIRIKFNKNIDSDTITADTVKVFAYNVLGVYQDSDPASEPGQIARKVEVSGDTLIITI